MIILFELEKAENIPLDRSSVHSRAILEKVGILEKLEKEENILKVALPTLQITLFVPRRQFKATSHLRMKTVCA